jgi:hypothetical protein
MPARPIKGLKSFHQSGVAAGSLEHFQTPI